MSRSLSILSALALGTLLACGGGSSGGGPSPTPTPTVATALVYSNPTSGSYQLLRNPSLSTPTHLVLDLVGPAGAQVRGVALVLTLTAVNQAAWAPVTSGGSNYLQEGAVLNLGSTPRALVGRTSGGGVTLETGLFQKGPATAAATLGSAPLASVALDLRPGMAPGSVSLGVVAARTFIQDAGGASVAVVPAVGILNAQ
jgi:hypothetical protein